MRKQEGNGEDYESKGGFRKVRENNAINKAKQMSCILRGHTWKKKILSSK